MATSKGIFYGLQDPLALHSTAQIKQLCILTAAPGEAAPRVAFQTATGTAHSTISLSCHGQDRTWMMGNARARDTTHLESVKSSGHARQHGKYIMQVNALPVR